MERDRRGDPCWTHPALRSPPFPELARRAWAAFLRLHARRGVGGYTMEPITFREVAAYRDLTGQHLTPDDVRLILDLDDWWLSATMAAVETTVDTSTPPLTTDGALDRDAVAEKVRMAFSLLPKA